ncbi:MAG: hypothetical protein KAI47_08065, partial [Deltaproteobacteria bacterium]|nr:hypothetical protein [Deltaproteobacteria bacterium]
CAADKDCAIPGETCKTSVCTSPSTCRLIPDAPGKELACGEEKNITCYHYDVENILLVTTRGGPIVAEKGWNTIYLYMGEAPFDNPDGYGNFKVACVKARYNDKNGAKLPATGRLEVPLSAWKPPSELDPLKDFVCPDGNVGPCEITP